MAQASTRADRCGRNGRNRLGVIVAVVVLGLVASGCGDSDDSAEPVDDTTTTVEEPTETVEATTVEDDVTESSGTAVQESDPEEEGPEFIELAYWEGILVDGFSRTTQPNEDCDDSDPGRLVCTFEQSVQAIATHLGSAVDTSTGTVTTYLSESCTGRDGTSGVPQVLEGQGSMETSWGDELHFRNRRESCLGATAGAGSGYLVFEGGTGRFEDSFGRLSIVNPTPLDHGFLSVGVGTLMVRADLWEEILLPL